MLDNVIKAELLPLDGKYYGTMYKVYYVGGGSAVLSVYAAGPWIPSDRQIEYCGVTREQYDNDEMLGEGWLGVLSTRDHVFDMCDSHMETRDAYELGKFIVDSINAHVKSREARREKKS